MLSCTIDVLREEYSDLISQKHRDKVAEAFNRCLIGKFAYCKYYCDNDQIFQNLKEMHHQGHQSLI